MRAGEPREVDLTLLLSTSELQNLKSKDSLKNATIECPALPAWRLTWQSTTQLMVTNTHMLHPCTAFCGMKSNHVREQHVTPAHRHPAAWGNQRLLRFQGEWPMNSCRETVKP